MYGKCIDTITILMYAHQYMKEGNYILPPFAADTYCYHPWSCIISFFTFFYASFSTNYAILRLLLYPILHLLSITMHLGLNLRGK